MIIRKTLLLAVLFFTPLFWRGEGGEACAQTVYVSNNGSEVALLKNTTAQITLFAGKYNEQKIYLNWDVINLKQNGLFLIYRSNDGVNFTIIGSKKATGVSIKKEIAYYFTDAIGFTEEKRYYHIVYVSSTYEYLVSERISISTEKATMARTPYGTY